MKAENNIQLEEEGAAEESKEQSTPRKRKALRTKAIAIEAKQKEDETVTPSEARW